MPNRRPNSRIAVAAEIQARATGSTRWVAANLLEISRDSARLVVNEAIGAQHERIEILLPSGESSGLVVGATITRVQPHDNGNLLVARLRSLGAAELAELERIFALLMGHDSSPRRASVSVSYRLNIEYRNLAELESILNDIGDHGFLMLALATTPEMYQTVRVVVSPPNQSELRFKARVVKIDAASRAADSTKLVGLQFQKLDDSKQRKIAKALRRLADSG
ncbi:MAG: PilZ domain-containing protein [Gammaproteobacteria bacterium]|nr:PilZ domain-containing protein [Gammaproteobacteria bacterium]MDH3467317.1 PilZ domain-containing protein [Gammaproteobacteria bacterium]